MIWGKNGGFALYYKLAFASDKMGKSIDILRGGENKYLDDEEQRYRVMNVGAIQRRRNTKNKKMNTEPMTHETEAIDYSIFQFPILARAVIDQMGGEESFLQSWEDIINHGINGGFSGFIYYSETTEFAKRNIKLIREMAKQQADDFGMGMLEMIKGFNCLGGDFCEDEIGETLWGNAEDQQILNALAWYSAEETCHQYSINQEA